jgi:hypothetical protein
MSDKKYCRRCGSEMEKKHNYLDDLPLISSATYSVPEPIVDANGNEKSEKTFEIYYECPKCFYVIYE